MPRRRREARKPGPPSPEHIAKSMTGSADDWSFGWEPWTAPALEDLLPQLSCEEQVRLQNRLREHERAVKSWNKNSPPLFNEYTEGERDSFIICHVRYALHHYNAKHPGEEFDAVKPLMESCVRFKGQMWYHVNFWARCRKSKKIKRFFAEVHYKLPPSNIVPVPGAKTPLSSSSVCSDLPFPDPEAEKSSSSSSVCSDLPSSSPEAEKSSRSSSVCLDPSRAPVPIVEACIIIEEPLGRYRKSCAFCRGHMDILHPKGRKFVCGNDKDRIEQQLFPGMITGVKMPFTCCLDRPSPNSQKN